jgi:hypothetical protein
VVAMAHWQNDVAPIFEDNNYWEKKKRILQQKNQISTKFTDDHFFPKN